MPQEKEKLDDKTRDDSSHSQDDNNVDSSTHKQDDNEQPNSLLDAVKAAAGEATDEDSSTPEKETVEDDQEEVKKNDDSKPDDEKKEPVEGDDEDDSEEDKAKDAKTEGKDAKPADSLDVLSEMFKNNPGVQNLIKEHRESKPKVAFADTIQSYIAKNNIPPETFNQAMAISALLVNDPAKALEVLHPIMERLKASTGEGALPEDLAQAVKEGEMTEKWAREHAKTRASTAMQQRSAQENAVRNNENASRQSVSQWEATMRQKDPDFDKKYPILEAKFVSLVTMNKATDPATLVKLAEEAYAFANKQASTFQPSKPQRKVFKSNGSSSNAKREPTSLKEVILQAAAAHS